MVKKYKKNIITLLLVAILATTCGGCVQIIKDSDGEIMYNNKRPLKNNKYRKIETDNDNQLIDDEFNIKFNNDINATPIRLEDGSYEMYENKILIYSGKLLDDYKRNTPVILEYYDDSGEYQRQMHNIMLKKNDKVYLRRAKIQEFLSDETLKASNSITYATRSVLKKREVERQKTVVRFVPIFRNKVATQTEANYNEEAEFQDAKWNDRRQGRVKEKYSEAENIFQK